MASAEMATTAMAGQADAAQLKEQGAQVTAQEAAIDKQIKELLGDDKYAQYTAYGKNISERVAVTEFEDQLAGGPRAVTSDQEQQLTSAMIEERQKFQFTTDFSDTSGLTGNIAAYYTEDRLKQYQQELEQLDQHCLERAQGSQGREIVRLAPTNSQVLQRDKGPNHHDIGQSLRKPQM